MKKTLVIGLAVLMSFSVLGGCIGEDEPETTTPFTVEKVEIPKSEDETGRVISESPPQTPSQNPPQTPSQNPPQTPSQNPPQTPSQTPPQTPSQTPPQTPMPPSDLEEPTPEKKEEAERIALEDERVQDLIQGSNYELEVIGCMFSPHDEDHCMLLLELENGEKYIIIVNMSEGIVEEIKEGTEQRDREGEKGENNGKSSDSS